MDSNTYIYYLTEFKRRLEIELTKVINTPYTKLKKELAQKKRNDKLIKKLRNEVNR